MSIDYAEELRRINKRINKARKLEHELIRKFDKGDITKRKYNKDVDDVRNFINGLNDDYMKLKGISLKDKTTTIKKTVKKKKKSRKVQKTKEPKKDLGQSKLFWLN